MKLRIHSFILAFLSTGFYLNAQVTSPKVNSPDGKITIKAEIKEKLEPYPTGKRLYYTVSYKGGSVIMDSPLGLDFNNMAPLAKNLVIKSVEQKSIDEPWERVCGKSKKVSNQCNEMQVKLEEADEPHRKLEIHFRAYNNGASFRYFIPEQAGMKEIELTAEHSEFHFNWDFYIWGAYSPGYIADQEFVYKNFNINEVTPRSIIGQPVIIPTGSCYLALSESNVKNWAGMFLTAGSTQNSLITRLTPRLDGSGLLVKTQAPALSPWRVIMIGEKAGNLIESDILQNLSDPSEIKDPSWIKPGKTVWDHWWSSGYAPDVKFKIGSNNASIKYYIDFGAEMGFPYMLVDAGWCHDYWDNPALKSKTDVTKPIDEVNIPELVQYAKSKNMRLIVWAAVNSILPQYEAAFALYEKWGFAGVKIDFVMHDDQEMTGNLYKMAEAAAKHHLLVDYHGCHIPTGITRTWPNVITSEGVYGNEHNKWGLKELTTPQHNVSIPFTRMLLGPMDYTPAAFKNVTLNNYKENAPDVDGTFVTTTRCQQLAMMVVYESPLQCLADAPYAYRGQPGLDFLKIVPSNWDETKVITGEIGQYIAIARRAGSDWYIGIMNGQNARTLDVALSFLGEGKYIADTWMDTYETKDFPDRLRKEQSIVSKTDVLKINLITGGGQVIRLSKK
jgi:alpha-glucosidase